MTVTTSVLANDGGAPARIMNFEASEDMTAGTAMEITAAGKVAMGSLERFFDFPIDEACCEIPGLIDEGTSASCFSNST